MILGAWSRESPIPIALAILSLVAFFAPPVVAQTASPPAAIAELSDRIDAILEEDPQWMMGDKLPDGLLLRRLSLDLRNVVPIQEELDAFLADSTENRWSRWVERFQKDPLASERLVDWYDKTLMQRRPFQHTDRGAWLQMLRKAVDDRASLDSVMRSIVTSAWWNRSQRAEQRFFLDRGGDPHAIARDIGRVFFGRDMQCAQCHDHPQIDDYLQIDYHGLLAFVSASSMAEGTTKDEKGADQKVQLYMERAAGDAPFESVFDKGIKLRTGTRVPGQVEQLEPYLAPDQRYQPQPKPDTFFGIGTPPVASRRENLASQLNASNRAFAENWANRLWAFMFGRGIVHPLDMHHSDNPPSNPKLLETITDALIASQFDAPAILAELARTRAYQRGYRLPVEAHSDQESVLNAPSELSIPWLEALKTQISAGKAEQVRLSEIQTVKQTMMEQARTAWRAIQQERNTIRVELDSAEGAFNEAQKKVAEAQKGLDQAVAVEKATAAKVILLEEASQKLEQAKNSPEDPELTPAIAAAKMRAEQMKAALPTQQQAIATSMTTRDTAVATREGERAKWQAVVDKLGPVEQRLLEADRAMVLARREHDDARALANIQSQRLIQAERFQRWFDLSSEIARKRSERKSLEQQLVDGMATLASHQTLVESAQQVVLGEQGKLEQHDQQIAAVAADLTAVESQLAQLQNAKKAITDSSVLVEDTAAFASAIAELDRASEGRMTKLAEVRTKMKSMSDQRTTMVAAVDTATAGRDQAISKRNEFDSQLTTILAQRDQAVTDLDAKVKQCVELRATVSSDRQTQHALAAERPLSPEQLALSILRSTNVLTNYIASEHAEMNKQGELPADASDAQKIEREKKAIRGAIDKLRGNIDIFSNLYSSGVGQTSDEFFASPDQALYFANGGAVHSWAGPNGFNVSSKVVQATDPQQGAKLLYEALLSREPSAMEQQFIVEQITHAGEQRSAVVQELVWSILASAEYRMYP